MFTTRQDSNMLSQKQWDYVSDQLRVQFIVRMHEVDDLISKLKLAQNGILGGSMVDCVGMHALFSLSKSGLSRAGFMSSKHLVNYFFQPRSGHINEFYSVAALKASFISDTARHKNAEEDFVFQEWIPFDIDGMNEAKKDDYVAVLETIFPTDGQRVYIWTGNGMQILCKVPPFSDAKLFNSLRSAYTGLCIDIEVAFRAKNLTGTVDTTAWSSAKMLRLPGTINQKWARDGSPGPSKLCYFISAKDYGASYRLWDKMAGQVISVPPRVSSGYSVWID